MNKENRVIKLEALWLKDADEEELGPYGFRLMQVPVGMAKPGVVLKTVDRSLLELEKPGQDEQKRRILRSYLQDFGAVSLKTALGLTELAYKIAHQLTYKEMTAELPPEQANELRRQCTATEHDWVQELGNGTRPRHGKKPPLYVGLFEKTVKNTSEKQNQRWFYVRAALWDIDWLKE